ncbi:MAG: PHB depolymerase family esterase [Saprospiraceae bacterium]
MIRLLSICLIILFASLGIISCKDDEPTKDFVLGKNRYTITVESTEREYYVHVPHGYTGDTLTPVVFMLHGTGQGGLHMYDNSGWTEVGEEENIITVFPSSLRFCIVDPDEGEKTTTKWNSVPAEWYPCTGVTLRDDIKFLNAVLDEVEERFNVDTKRVYLAGFSNGGQMAAKCTVQFSDRLAAVVEDAGSFYVDTTYTPLRKLPTLYMLGNEDYGPGGTGPTIPLSKMDSVLARTDIRAGKASLTHVKSFGLSSSYTMSGDTNTFVIATYPSLNPGSDADYRFVYVNGLKHAYPNGTNHWMEAAKLHWAWFKQYRLE